MPQAICLYFVLGPCAGLFVVILYLISKYVGLACCIIKLHIYWNILQSASVLRLCEQKEQTKIPSNCSKHFIMRDSCCDFARPMLPLMFRATHAATNVSRDSFCDFARLILRLCATHVATLRDVFLAMLRLKPLAGAWKFGRNKSILATQFGRNIVRGPRY